MTKVMTRLLNRNYSRRTRRVGVLLMYASYPGLPISSALATTAQFNGWATPVRLLCWTLLALVAIGFFAGTWFAGLRGIRSRIFPYTVGASDQVLDERQRVAKYRAYRTSYWVLAALALAALTASILASAIGVVAVLIVLPLWIVFLWVAISLPFAIIAWSEPDPDNNAGETGFPPSPLPQSSVTESFWK
jgi:hypothetical protein